MNELVCKVTGPSKKLDPQVVKFDLDTEPVWTVKGAIGPRGLSRRALDLLDLAGAIYRTESGTRKRVKDPPLEWQVTAPVRDLTFWRECGGEHLERVLGFLNRSHWKFNFAERNGALDLTTPSALDREFDEIILFSGGMDSLCGAGLHSGQAGRAGLVSFYHKQAKLQQDLAAKLRFDPPSQWRLRGSRGREGMNLVRSFMFLSLGAAVAETFGSSRIFQYENGVLAAAIPPAGNFIPTRHAHPETHRLAARLFEAVLDRKVSIENPFLSLTKRQAVKEFSKFVGSRAAEDMLRITETCWYLVQPRVAGLSKQPGQPCGACVPCIVRRTARPNEVEKNAWPGWPGYAYDLSRPKSQKEEKLGTSFRGYLELIQIVLSNNNDDNLVRELSPEARQLIGGPAGPTKALVCQVLREFAAEFCSTFGISAA
jgi:7-cyano-7-deazaguanine synthase in queuosine biosynthesis